MNRISFSRDIRAKVKGNGSGLFAAAVETKQIYFDIFSHGLSEEEAMDLFKFCREIAGKKNPQQTFDFIYNKSSSCKTIESTPKIDVAMSLQDDYFDLISDLKDEQKMRVERIWNAMIDYENEVEKLRPIVNKLRSAIEELFENKDG